MVRSIDWGLIFERNPSLAPPGYEETVEALKQRPRRERKRSKAHDTEARLTSITHTNPDP